MVYHSELRRSNIRIWGIILREQFFDELLQLDLRIILKHHNICDNPWSVLVFLLFRNCKILFDEDVRQETELNSEPEPNEQLKTSLHRLTLLSAKYTDKPNVIYKNRIARILKENQCWMEMERLREVNSYQELRNFSKIPARLPLRSKPETYHSPCRATRRNARLLVI